MRVGDNWDHVFLPVTALQSFRLLSDFRQSLDLVLQRDHVLTQVTQVSRVPETHVKEAHCCHTSQSFGILIGRQSKSRHLVSVSATPCQLYSRPCTDRTCYNKAMEIKIFRLTYHFIKG